MFLALFLVLGLVAGSPSLADDPPGEDTSDLFSSRDVDPELVRDFMVDFNESPDDWRAVFERYLDDLGPEVMLQALEDQFPLCHHQATDLGAALYARTKDLDATLDACGDRCTSGCQQGAIREAFGGGPLAKATAQLGGLCEDAKRFDSEKKGSCAHAVGRAAMMASGYRLEAALDACDTAKLPAMRYYCATGVYREYFAAPTDLPVEALLDLHYPCNQSVRYPAACYRYKVPLMLSALDGSDAALDEECARLEGAARLGCVHGIGLAHLADVYQDPARLAAVCHQSRRDERRLCIEGAVEKLADYQPDAARAACETLEGKDRKTCLAAAKEKMYRLSKPSLPLYTEP